MEQSPGNAHLFAGRHPSLTNVHDGPTVVMEDQSGECRGAVRFHLARCLATFENTSKVFAHHGNRSRILFVTVALCVFGL
jgi:hypothetical protein